MNSAPDRTELVKRIQVLFGVVPPAKTSTPEESPYAVPADVQAFKIPIPTQQADPADATSALKAWLATPNPSLGGLCPQNLIKGSDDERAFLGSFLSSIEDGSFS